MPPSSRTGTPSSKTGSEPIHKILIEEFERRYLELFWKFQREQWEHYACDAHHNVSAIDNEIFDLVVSFKDRIKIFDRRSEVISAVITRELVDRHPEVTRLRNCLDDEEYNYGHGLSTEDPAYRLTLARRMKPDVLALMQARNRLSRGLQFPSYVSLVLSTEGLEYQSLFGLLERYLRDNLEKAREVAGTYQISLTPQWFSNTHAIGHVAQDLRSLQIIPLFLERLGLDHIRDKVSVYLKEAGFGYDGVLSPDDIRIMICGFDDLHSWITVFHELGHATAHALNEESGIFRTWTNVYNETMAEVFEPIAVYMFLDEANQSAFRELKVLENTRHALSARFELELWEHPEAAERLYVKHFSQLDVEMGDPEMWVLDSFRYSDPVYIHNYVIGHQIATQTFQFLRKEFGDDFPNWGEWLKSNYYADGRKRTLQEKAACSRMGSDIGI